MAVTTLYGDGVVTSADWTNPSNATGEPDASSATTGTIAAAINLTLGNLPGSGDIEATAITFGARWTAVHGTTGRAQSALIELLDGSNTVLFSVTSAARNNAALIDVTSAVTPTYTRAQVDALRVRVTTQEGTGMAGTQTHYVDAVWATVTYTEFSNFEQDKYRFRNDDGSESAATWIAAADTAASIDVYSGNRQARLRFVVKETGGVGESITPQLEAGISGEAATWTQRDNSFGTTQQMWGIAHGNGVWVAGGTAGINVHTATDPAGTWTARTSNLGAVNAYALAYGNSVWVVAGASGALSTATDPTGTWTARTSSFGTSNIRSVAYGNGVWVAVGADGKLATATDPTGTWTLRTSSFDTSTIWRVVYDNTVWVAVGNDGKLATATDPTGTWTQQTSSFGASPIYGVAYGNGVWVAVGLDGKLATATSPTGTWTQRTSSFDTTQIYNTVYGDGWVAVGVSGKLATATDPTGTWTQQTSSFGTTNVTNVAYATELWVAVGWAGKHATGVNIAWSNVTTTSTPVKAFDSTNLTNGGNTTQQVGIGTFITPNAGISEDGTGGPTTFAGSDETEYEYTVEFISADLADGDQVLLRIANVDTYSA